MQNDVQVAKQPSAERTWRQGAKGQSGNPFGRPDGRRYRETYAALVAEFGELTESQKLLADEIAMLKARRRGSDPVRSANTVGKLLKQLGAGRKREAAKPSLDDYARLHGDVP